MGQIINSVDKGATDDIPFYTLISNKHKPDKKPVEPEETSTGFFKLTSSKHKPDTQTAEPNPTGFFKLTSTKYATSGKNFQPVGINTFVLSNYDWYEYNDLSFDKTSVKIYAPLELEKGWYCDRDVLKNHSEYVTNIEAQLETWEAEKDNPKSKIKKPCLDRNSIVQIDTEFNFFELPLDVQEKLDLYIPENRDHHTTQVKFLPGWDGIAPNIIFATKNFSKIINPILEEKGYQSFPVLSEKDCDFFDYANLVTDINWSVKTNAPDGYINSLPKFFLTLSAHNAEAELNLIFHGRLKKRIQELQNNYSIDEGIEKRSKVVRCFSNISERGNKVSVDWVSLKAIVNIDGTDFHLCLRIIDTIKVQGIVSLGNFAKASGYKMDAKDFLSKKDKSNFLKAMRLKTEDSIAYSLGDTCNLEILFAFYLRVGESYATWELEKYFQSPTLTIGRTVVELDFAAIADGLTLETDE